MKSGPRVARSGQSFNRTLRTPAPPGTPDTGPSGHSGHECQESGAICVVSSRSETFCGRACDATKPCPAEYQCLTVTIAGGKTSRQCIPNDFSCYDRSAGIAKDRMLVWG